MPWVGRLLRNELGRIGSLSCCVKLASVDCKVVNAREVFYTAMSVIAHASHVCRLVAAADRFQRRGAVCGAGLYKREAVSRACAK